MGGATFTNHRGVVPLLWVFAALATLELCAVHLFVALKWPNVGWPLSILSLISLVWLIGWIRSWHRLPHELDGEKLRLHMGSLRRCEVPLEWIDHIERDPSIERIKVSNAARLVPVAHPNRLLVLNRAIPGRRQISAVAIRLDEPAAFDAALTERGVIFV